MAPLECKWSCPHPVLTPEPHLLSLSPPLLPAFSLPPPLMLRVPNAKSRGKASSRQQGTGCEEGGRHLMITPDTVQN